MINTDGKLFGRMITAMVTPFDEHLQIDFKAVEAIVEHLIATGTSAIIVAGTTGESPALDDDEKEALLKAVIAVSNKRIKVLMGTGTNVTAKSIKATQHAEKLGADGALIVAPYYNKPSQAGLLAHFSAIAQSSSLPLIIYNIPARTGINISADTIVALSKKEKTVHALKDSTGNVDQASDIAAAAREDFLIYSGDDNMTLPFLSIGACGIISVASHVIGRQIMAMQNAFFDGKLDGARELHYQCMPMFKGLFIAPNPTCVKYVLAKMGLCTEHLRLPLVPLDTNQRETMDALINNYKLDQSLQLT
ncbi:4-hydroxy-tetrahydrodipicolinate synthase [soil metagenome]